jgi:error-prone DNA polymerase
MTTGEKIDLDATPPDDPATFELIRASRTLGCFQIESPGQRELLQKFQPTRWEHLIVDISLFRPGPVKSDMVTPFLRRRHDLEPPVYAHPDLRPVLSETHGVIVYHEQVLKALRAMAGYDLTEADAIRRRLDDEEHLDGMRLDFVQRAVARGVTEPDADKVWKEIAAFASFGFCKAHAAAFAVPTYHSAFLKAHWPAHFLSGVLTHEPGMYPRRLILEDARQEGVPILPLDVNRSEKNYSVEEVDTAASQNRSAAAVTANGAPAAVSWDESAPQLDGAAALGGGGDPRSNAYGLESLPDPGSPPRCGSGGAPHAETAAAKPWGIRLALKDVEGMSEVELRSILEVRADRPFRDVGDFIRRTRVSRPVVERLAHAGAFDALPGGSRRDRLYRAMVTESDREGEQLALPIHADVATTLREYSAAERVRAELEVMELDASRHLLSFFEPLLTDLGVTRSRDLRHCRTDQWVMVAGVKVSSQTPAIRSGQRIIFLTLDDATGPVDVTVFQKVQPRCAKTVFHSFLLVVWGKLRRTGYRGVSIIAEEVWDLSLLNRARRKGRLEEALTAGGSYPAGLPPKKLWHASGGSAGW